MSTIRESVEKVLEGMRLAGRTRLQEPTSQRFPYESRWRIGRMNMHRTRGDLLVSLFGGLATGTLLGVFLFVLAFVFEVQIPRGLLFVVLMIAVLVGPRIMISMQGRRRSVCLFCKGVVDRQIRVCPHCSRPPSGGSRD